MDHKEKLKQQNSHIYWVNKPVTDIFNPVNKSVHELIEKNKQKNKERLETYQNSSKLKSHENNQIAKKTEDIKNNENPIHDDFTVSIITCTNRKNYLTNIFQNFYRQSFSKKELIIILNSNKLNLNMWRERAKEYDNIRIFQLDEKVSLGECLNFAIEKSNHNIIAKFDDDDYYGSNYLNQAVNTLRRTNAHVVGKSTSYVFFENNQTLAVRNPGRENRFIYRVEGPTLVFKKEIFKQIRFSDKNLGEDVKFCKDCCEKKFKIFSTDKENFVYIRHGKKSQHTWAIDDDYYLKLCNIIGHMKDFSNYVS